MEKNIREAVSLLVTFIIIAILYEFAKPKNNSQQNNQEQDSNNEED